MVESIQKSGLRMPIFFAATHSRDPRAQGGLRARRAQKRVIRINRTARTQTRDAQMDLEKMLAAAVIEQSSYFGSIVGALVNSARESFRFRREFIEWPMEADWKLAAHIRRVAELFAGTRILGRVQVRKEAGLKLTGTFARPSRSVWPDLGQRIFAETLGDVSPTAALEYLKALPVATRAEWERLIARNQGPAFTAAGVEQKAALAALKRLVMDGLDGGWTEPQFVKAATEMLAKFQTQAGSLRTLWNTTVGNALARGREEELRQPDVVELIPYRLFDAIIDARTRPNHRELDNGIARWDWEGWARYAPLLGFNCRCTLIGITQTRAEQMIASGEGFDLEKGVPFGAGPDSGFEKAA